MAIETLNQVSNALSQLFAPEITRQYNRQAVFASLLQVKAGRGNGKNVNWGVEFSGTTASTVAEGSDVQASEFATDIPLAATLSWATYRSSFQISENEIDGAAQSLGSPDALLDMFGERVLTAGHKLVSQINSDMFTGNGVDGSGNPNIVGLYGGQIDSTGTYAGLNRATYAEWAGSQLGNGGVARPLTLDLLYQLEAAIFANCGEPPTHFLASAGVLRKYASLFETIRRVEGQTVAGYNTGTPMSAMANPATDSYAFKGIPIIRDRNASTGKFAAINTNYLDVAFLPHINPGDAFGYGMTQLSGSTGNNAAAGNPGQTPTGIPARVVLLAKTGDSVKASVKTVIQVRNRRPNSMGYLSDLSEV